MFYLSVPLCRVLRPFPSPPDTVKAVFDGHSFLVHFLYADSCACQVGLFSSTCSHPPLPTFRALPFPFFFYFVLAAGLGYF